MALVTPWPSYRQAIIRQLRANLVLKDQLLGDWSEGFAPQDTDYPLGIIALHYAPDNYDWTGVVTIIGFDVFVFSKVDMAEADSLNQLVFDTLQDAKLYPTGQTSLKCRRTSSISLTDNDAQGVAVWQVGGTWEGITAQSNPRLVSLPFTIDSSIT
jgi:hypothetical protein